MEKVKLGDICEVFSGFAFKTFNEDKQGKPVIKIGNIQIDGKISLEECSYTKEIPQEKYFSKVNDIYIALSGATTGKVGIMEQGDFLINQRVGVVRLKNNNIPINYLFSFLKSKTVTILQDAFGAAQPNISPKDILNYEIPLPSLEEQKAIAERLDKVSGLIEKRKTQLEKLDLLIKSRFIEMFGACENSIRLGDCCEVHARIGWQALTRDEHMKTGDYMLITGTDFKNGEINYQTCVYVAKARYEMDKHIILRDDDVLITKDGTIGKVAIIHNLPKPATLNAGVFVVRPDERFNKEYIANVFKGPLFSDYVEASKTGATIKHLNQKHLVEFMIPVPSLEEQETFAQFTQQTDKSKFEIQKSLEKLEILKKSLMQQYFG